MRVAGVAVLRFESPVYFGNAQFLFDELQRMQALAVAEGGPRAVVLDCTCIPELDSSGVRVLNDFARLCAERDTRASLRLGVIEQVSHSPLLVFVLAGLDGDALATARLGGLDNHLRSDRLFARVHDAVTAVSAGRVLFEGLVPEPPSVTPLARLVAAVRPCHALPCAPCRAARQQHPQEHEQLLPAAVPSESATAATGPEVV
jgi:hypothetical protein